MAVATSLAAPSTSPCPSPFSSTCSSPICRPLVSTMGVASTPPPGSSHGLSTSSLYRDTDPEADADCVPKSSTSTVSPRRQAPPSTPPSWSRGTQKRGALAEPSMLRARRQRVGPWASLSQMAQRRHCREEVMTDSALASDSDRGSSLPRASDKDWVRGESQGRGGAGVEEGGARSGKTKERLQVEGGREGGH